MSSRSQIYVMGTFSFVCPYTLELMTGFLRPRLPLTLLLILYLVCVPNHIQRSKVLYDMGRGRSLRHIAALNGMGHFQRDPLRFSGSSEGSNSRLLSAVQVVSGLGDALRHLRAGKENEELAALQYIAALS